jgi:hypothetical protein
LIAQPPATWDEMTVALRSAIVTRLKHSRG